MHWCHPEAKTVRDIVILSSKLVSFVASLQSVRQKSTATDLFVCFPVGARSYTKYFPFSQTSFSSHNKNNSEARQPPPRCHQQRDHQQRRPPSSTQERSSRGPPPQLVRRCFTSVFMNMMKNKRYCLCNCAETSKETWSLGLKTRKMILKKFVRRAWH